MFSRISNSLFYAGKRVYKSSYTCSCRIVKYETFSKRRTFCSKNVREKLRNNETEKESEHNPTYTVSDKYKVFKDEDSPVVFDVDEERNKINLAELNIEEEEQDPYAGINLKRE